MTMTLPTTPDTVDIAYLQSLLRRYSDEPEQEVTGFNVQRLGKGTSGAQLYLVEVNRAAIASAMTQNAPLRLILKLGGGRKEIFFYRELASRLPVDTPKVLDARLLDNGSAWLLMEEITDVKDGLDWEQDDYKGVLSDMARLHARFWGRTNLLDDCPWLWRPDEQSIQALVAARKSDLDTIAATGLPQALPELFGMDRLALASKVLAEPEKLFGPMLAAGFTLVHGDYWFHNVQITSTGRRVLVDWQDPQVWSGLWELAYFLNLLLVVGSDLYRDDLPLDEELMIGWYADALAEAGVVLPKSVFDQALLSARIWHPLQHWIRQFSHAMKEGLLPTRNIQEEHPGAVRFLTATFARWDHDLSELLDA